MLDALLSTCHQLVHLQQRQSRLSADASVTDPRSRFRGLKSVGIAKMRLLDGVRDVQGNVVVLKDKELLDSR